MVRISKQQERRSISPKRPTRAGKKTGSLPKAASHRQQENAVTGQVFIPKIK